MSENNIYVLKDYTKILYYTKIPDDKTDIEKKDEKVKQAEQLFYTIKKNELKAKLIKDNSVEEKEIRDIVIDFSGNLMVGKYVGFFEVPILENNEEDNNDNENATIIIKSRFDNEKMFFTNYILEKAFGIRSYILEDKTNMDKSNIMELMLAFLFVEQVKEAYKSGIFRQYRTFEKNDLKVKGKIDIARHIKQNPIFNGKIAYSYREYTADNDINKIIYTAYNVLCKKNKMLMDGILKTKENRTALEYFNKLGTIVGIAERSEISQLIKTNKKKITHSVYKKWEDVRITAIMILRHLGIYTGASNNQEVNGILLDMPTIWEKYLEKIFEENMSDVRIQTQGECEKGILFKENDPERKIRPDFILEKEEKKTIIDAKYKNVWSEFSNKNKEKISLAGDDYRDDIYQVMAYMYRTGIETAGIVCPAQDTEYIGYTIDQELHKDAIFSVFSLGIPMDSENYNKFKEEIKESENKLCNLITKLLENKVQSS